MDSKGHVIAIEDDRVVSRSEKPMPNPARGHLVLAALDAGHKAGWPDWWKELAPLTRREREFVRAQAPTASVPAKLSPATVKAWGAAAPTSAGYRPPDPEE